MIPHRLLAALLLGGLFASQPVRAAESYDNCMGFIDSVPATIATQGVWCLRKDLSTAMASGFAVVVNANNVTIDCNDFKLGGLAAGSGSQTHGIYTPPNISNVTVRNCNVRGFYTGINLSGTGHLVEDNRVDDSRFIGIRVWGEQHVVQRNRVFGTGGFPNSAQSYGITVTGGDVIGNLVHGVTTTSNSMYVRGIEANTNYGGHAVVVRDNQVHGVRATGGTGTAAGGIVMFGSAGGGRIENNHVVSPNGTGYGIQVLSTLSFCVRNTALNYATPFSGCDHSAGNLP